MKRSLVAFSLTLVTIFSGSANPDSLLLVLQSAQSSIERIDVLNALSNFYIDYSFQKSIAYGSEALNLSSTTDYQKGEATAHLNLGWMYWESSHYKKALPHLHAARHLFFELGDTALLAKSNYLIGILYFYIVKKDSSLKYLHQSRDQYTAIGDSVSLALLLTELSILHETTGNSEASNQAAVEAYTMKLTDELLRVQYGTWLESGFSGQAYQNENILHSLLPANRRKFEASKRRGDPYQIAETSSKIADLYQVLGNYDSTIYYYQLSLNIYDSLDLTRGKTDALSQIAECYLFQKDTSRAKGILEDVYSMRLEEKDYPGLGVTLDYLGRIALKENNTAVALDYFQKAIVLSDTLGHVKNVIRFNRRLSDTYRAMGDYTRAIETANRSFNIAKEMGSLSHRTWGAEKVYLAYKEAKQFDKALEYHTIYNALSIERERNNLDRENLQFQSVFELNEKAREIELLSEQNISSQSQIDLQRSYLISAILGAFIVLLLAGFFYNRLRTIRSLNRKISDQNSALTSMNSEKEVLLKEIHHRVKNNLQVVSSLLGMQKRRIDETSTRQLLGYTQNRLRSMGLIHEHLYRNDTLSTIRLRPYIEELVNSIYDSLHDAGRPNTRFEITDYEVDIDTAIPLGLIINELTTNAVKYAFEDHPEPSLEITIHEVEGLLKLTVKDNGPGGVISQTGFGWTIITSIVENLSGSTETRGENGLEVNVYLKDYQLKVVA